MTSHKTFNLPLNLDQVEAIRFKSKNEKKRLYEADIIIWDEASMIPKKALEIVDLTLRDLTDKNEPFGGKKIVLGGDFRQILPVIKHSNPQTIIEESIKCSNLWSLFQIEKLKTNMRAREKKFVSLLLNIGEGKIKTFKIPPTWVTGDVCKKIYGKIDFEQKLNKVILASHNEDVTNLNNRILHMMPNDVHTYYSTDYASYKCSDQCDDDIELKWPIEVINSVTDGLPPHKLQLKINCIVMLIRNLSVNEGLCTGTRLKITKLYEYNIKAEILTGEKIGNVVFIPKITLKTDESSDYPFIAYRKQFPIILAFAMTINKSQGQSFDEVGLYINRPLFSHGQLYVALSRCKNYDKIFIENDSENCDIIENVVWREIFKL
uniref:ATP-dependent DNA helicase n=1 Tax=Trichogramma kaykai TaxID=54128 RepID=A0ABD2WRM7_9HYME